MIFEYVRARSVSVGREGEVRTREFGRKVSEPLGLLYLRRLNYKVRSVVIRVSPSEELYGATVSHT